MRNKPVDGIGSHGLREAFHRLQDQGNSLSL
jgi:hypothetical protein